MRNKLAVLILMGLFGLSAHAEPLTLLGFTLGTAPPPAPLCTVPSGIPVPQLCLRIPPFVDARGMTSMDYRLPLAKAPVVVRDQWVGVLLINGKVESISFATPGATGQELALQLLTEKFGQPTTTETTHNQNSYGAQFEGKNATWELDGAVAKFEGVRDAIDWGRFELASQTYKKAYSEWINKNSGPKL
jgi:hypothetical protein